ncbi:MULTISPECIES: hypothetical protein [Porphyromonas]|nr:MULTISPECIES: hypothetical protein [Porphyromonas]
MGKKTGAREVLLRSLSFILSEAVREHPGEIKSGAVGVGAYA